MKIDLWTIDFDTGYRMYVSASTVKTAIKNAVWGYNKDFNTNINSKRVTMVCIGKLEDYNDES